MGSQQLLLIVVGVVLIGIMIAVGMVMFKDQAGAMNRDSISNDLVHFAVQAQKYYRRPRILGGGEHSFNGLTLARLTKIQSNSNGAYQLTPDPVSANNAFVTITGIGTNNGNDGSTPVQVQARVWPDSTLVITVN